MDWLLICTGQLKLERGGQLNRFFHITAETYYSFADEGAFWRLYYLD